MLRIRFLHWPKSDLSLHTYCGVERVPQFFCFSCPIRPNIQYRISFGIGRVGGTGLKTKRHVGMPFAILKGTGTIGACLGVPSVEFSVIMVQECYFSSMFGS